MVPGRGCRVWHIPGRCRQPPPASARLRSGCRSHPALASQSQARSSRSAPRCGPWPGCSFVAGRPPGPRSARPGHGPRPTLLFEKLRTPASGIVLPSSARACAPVAAAAAHHSGSYLACTASSLQSAARASRSQRVRSRQGILPVKSFAVGIQWRREAPRRQTFAGCPSLTRARPPRWGAHRFGFGQNKWVPVVRPLRGTV